MWGESLLAVEVPSLARFQLSTSLPPSLPSAKLVFSDEDEAGGGGRGPKGGPEAAQGAESGKPGAARGPEKAECRPQGPAGPKLPSSRGREASWDSPAGQQPSAQQQQRPAREPAPYMDRVVSSF